MCPRRAVLPFYSPGISEGLSESGDNPDGKPGHPPVKEVARRDVLESSIALVHWLLPDHLDLTAERYDVTNLETQHNPGGKDRGSGRRVPRGEGRNQGGGGVAHGQRPQRP